MRDPSMLRKASTPSIPSWAHVLALLALALAATACDPGEAPDERAGPPAPDPDPPTAEPLEAPWTSPALREVVELQAARDEPALRARLDDTEPAVRARAAFALASFPESEAGAELEALLEDPQPEVRRAAAFALERVSPPEAPASLLDRLATEEDEEVRAHLLASAGSHGQRDDANALLAVAVADVDEEYHRTRALARIARREVPSREVRDALLERLEHDHPRVRKAASHFLRNPNAEEAWGDRAPEVREILDAYPRSEAAAMNVLRGLGSLADTEDRDRLVEWMEEGEDWRVRVTAAQALGTNRFLALDGTRSALWRQVESAPTQVALAAADAYAGGFIRPPALREQMVGWVREGPPERWRTQAMFLRQLSEAEAEAILDWTERVGDEHPGTAMGALRWLGLDGRPEVGAYIWEMAGHSDPAVRGQAAELLALRTMAAGTQPDEEELEEIFSLLEDLVGGGGTMEVSRAARAMALPVFGLVDSPERIVEAAESRAEEDPSPPILAALLRAVAETGAREGALAFADRFTDHPDGRVRTTANWAADLIRGEANAPSQAGAEPHVDWEHLQELGPEPRLHLEMDHGEVVIRLLSTEAPLTVQTVTRLAQEGSYDGVPFHRVGHNSAARTGDYTFGDGSGDPGFEVPVERTRPPFHRGRVGMTLRGQGTHDSQFFITHSWQSVYEGDHAVVGWVESGADVLDGILPEDRIRRAWVEPGGPG